MLTLTEADWKSLALFVSQPAVADVIIEHAKLTPYRDLPGYMNRDWLFNPYGGDEATGRIERQFRDLPSIRVHHILREDLAEHPHDHPWESRTIILRGWYRERRYGMPTRVMRAGDTSPIRYGDFHHIEEVSEGGVHTLFFTWDYIGTWGFLVDGVKVPYRQYLAEHPERPA